MTTDEVDRVDLVAMLDELVAEGALRMLMAGLETEVADHIERHCHLVDADGLRMVVRNGKAAERTLVTGAGALKIRAPRVDDRREGHRFSSYILPKYARRSPKVADVLPVLYLRGLSTGDFAPALTEFFGSDAGLSASSITRLLETWSAEYTAFDQRDLSGSDYVYVWADGVHFRIRLEEDRLCCLVVVGVKADGTKELLACSDGYRESAESWADVLRDLKARGMEAPMLAVGDGALGFWGALGDVFPETVEQRCWVHYVDLLVMSARRLGACGCRDRGVLDAAYSGLSSIPLVTLTEQVDDEQSVTCPGGRTVGGLFSGLRDALKR